MLHSVQLRSAPVQLNSSSFFVSFSSFKKEKDSWSSRAYHHFVVAIAHVDGILGWHHVPQPVAAQDDVAVALGVKGHHGGVGLGRDHKLTTVEVVAPQITL